MIVKTRLHFRAALAMTYLFLLSILTQIQAQTLGNVIPDAVDDIKKANQSQIFWYDNY